MHARPRDAGGTVIRDDRETGSIILQTMGGASARRSDGADIGLGRKALALLVFLSFAPENRARRDKLADLLWPDRTTEQARNCLRQTVSVIRINLRWLGRDIFGGGRDSLSLLPGTVTCDAIRLLSASTAARAPLTPPEGPFLDGFHSGSEVFDEWATALRSRIETALVTDLHQRARSADVEEGLAILDRLMAIDPTREANYQLGMELHAAAHQRDRALRCYEACRQMLATEYGVTPSPETERIRRRILESTGPVQDAARPDPPTAGRSTIRVHPFANLSTDGSLDLFLRGLLEAVVIDLSAVPELDVVQSDGDGGTAGSDRVEFALHGSFLSAGDHFQIIMRLIHCRSGRQIAGERLRGDTGRHVDMLDDIALSVALSTRFEVLQHRWGMRDITPADPFPVRLLVMRAHARYYELTQASLTEAIRLAEAALALAPDSLRAQRILSLALTAAMVQGALPRNAANRAQAIHLARTVARAVPEDVFTRCVLAWALGNDGQPTAAVDELQYAIRLNPVYATLHSDLADHYAILGYVNEALTEVEEAIRLSPEDVVSFWRYHTLAVAHFAGGNFPLALENARRVMRDKPGILRGALFRAASAAALGLTDEARQTIAYCLHQWPALTLSNVTPDFMPRYAQDRHHRLFLNMLRLAGLPEG